MWQVTEMMTCGAAGAPWWRSTGRRGSPARRWVTVILLLITASRLDILPAGGPPRTLGLLRGDRADAGQAEGRHRHRAGRPQVRQAGQGKVRHPVNIFGRHRKYFSQRRKIISTKILSSVVFPKYQMSRMFFDFIYFPFPDSRECWGPARTFWRETSHSTTAL